MAKALVLLSGGLDSLLAARVLMEQGIEVTGLSFKSYFFGTAKAKKVAEQLGVKLIEIDFSVEHLAMVKNPKHGYGKNMNPCIDCHALMLKKAKEIMEEKIPLNPPSCPTPARQGHSGGEQSFGRVSGGRYDFVATGEVLGERPMSQNMAALIMVEKEAGLIGHLIRPLSAKLLPESELERSGKVIRGKLLDISGRSRKLQLALVRKYGIKEYASPGGGCLLTDPAFSEKLMKLLEYWPESDGLDAEILKSGRLFWLKEKAGKNILLVIGREREDNERLEQLVKPHDILIKFSPLVAGPTSLIRGIRNKELGIKKMQIDVPAELKLSELKFDKDKNVEEILNIAMTLTGYYAAKSRGKKVKLEIQVKK